MSLPIFSDAACKVAQAVASLKNIADANYRTPDVAVSDAASMLRTLVHNLSVAQQWPRGLTPRDFAGLYTEPVGSIGGVHGSSYHETAIKLGQEINLTLSCGGSLGQGHVGLVSAGTVDRDVLAAHWATIRGYLRDRPEFDAARLVAMIQDESVRVEGRRREPPDLCAKHSDDFTDVWWFGDHYTFTKTQAACVGVLWRNWERGTPEIRGESVLAAEEVDASAESLPKVFRVKGKYHAAWDTMIKPSRIHKGAYLLCPPKHAGPAEL